MSSVLCIGNAVQDFVFAVERFPASAEKHPASAFDSVGGGPAATAAVAIARLGGTAMLATRLGDDGVADLIVAELEGYGVDCALARRFGGCRSSLSAVLVDADGERMIVNYLDADLPADPGWLPPALPPGTAAVLADSRWPEGGAALLSLARRAGLPAVLDADRPAPPDALIRAASHIAFSGEGLAAWAENDDHEGALKALAADTGAWCGVTLGARGVVCVSDGTVTRVPALPVRAVDTLGAGDVWHGAFTLGLADGQDEIAAVRFASAAAALKVQRFGGRAGVPTRAEVDQLLADALCPGEAS